MEDVRRTPVYDARTPVTDCRPVRNECWLVAAESHLLARDVSMMLINHAHVVWGLTSFMIWVCFHGEIMLMLRCIVWRCKYMVITNKASLTSDYADERVIFRESWSVLCIHDREYSWITHIQKAVGLCRTCASLNIGKNICSVHILLRINCTRTKYIAENMKLGTDI